MPELPEVETIRRDLLDAVLDKPIVKVCVKKPKLVKQPVDDFVRVLSNNQFSDIERRGKLLVFTLRNNWYLLIHLKMTGQLMYQSRRGVLVGGHSISTGEFSLPNAYSHVIFSFADETTLYFNCMRQFGYLKVVDRKERDEAFCRFGVEPLDRFFREKDLRILLRNRKINIKAFLLNQALIAGIGNIYADESCFLAGIRPERRVDSLDSVEVKHLYDAIRQILRKAIKERGTTFNNYLDANGKKGNFLCYLKVYGRGGKPCLTCGTALSKIKVAGRGTVFCPICQH